jgi:deoxyadenosine/deoxycytidine kinase
MTKPKLILLYGFAGIGKTTIAKRYVNQHPLAMNLDQDRIIEMLGLWPEHEAEARKLVAELCKTLTTTYLRHDHDIIIPCLPTKTDSIQDFESIAKKTNAHFLEIALMADKEAAIQRLLKRGRWGEQNAPPITKTSLPTVEKLYDDAHSVLEKRPAVIYINSVEDNPEDTYRQFLTVLQNHTS